MGSRGPSHRLTIKVVLQNSTSGRVVRPFLLGMVLFILSSAPSGTAKAQKLPTTPTTMSSKFSSGPETVPLPAQTEQAIPFPQIADRANELHNLLVETYQHPLSAKDALPSERSTRVRAEEIRERRLFVDALVKGIPTSLDLRDEDQLGVFLSRQFTSERKFLSSRVISLQNQIQFLEIQQSVCKLLLIKYTKGAVSKAW